MVWIETKTIKKGTKIKIIKNKASLRSDERVKYLIAVRKNNLKLILVIS